MDVLALGRGFVMYGTLRFILSAVDQPKDIARTGPSVTLGANGRVWLGLLQWADDVRCERC